MRRSCYRNDQRWSGISPVSRNLLLSLMGVMCTIAVPLSGQDSDQGVLEKRIEQLTDAMTRTQAQLEESQRQLEELRRQLEALRQQIAGTAAANSSSSDAAQLARAVDEIRERQAIQESQIATHDEDKVESASKYPVKLTGLILLNGFVNTRQVDVAATPAIAIDGAGSTGVSMRQTVLGLDARGPTFSAQAVTRTCAWTLTAILNHGVRPVATPVTWCVCERRTQHWIGSAPESFSHTTIRSSALIARTR